MTNFADVMTDISTRLQGKGYGLHPTGVSVSFSTPRFATPILAIPDIHLCDGGGGDIFLGGEPGRAAKLQAVMEVTRDYWFSHPMSFFPLQLGDWFDIWRVCGEDPRNMTYGKIQTADAYQKILELDQSMGLPHVIGNHDAGFLRSLPDRRVGQPERFRLGFWLGSNVYALHGHQHDLTPPAGSSFDETAVHIATILGSIAPQVTEIEKYFDRLGAAGIVAWLRDTFLGIRQDPQQPPRPPDHSQPPSIIRSGTFVVRENVDALASIVTKVGALPESHGRSADVVIVGHSHAPCAAWTDVTKRPIVVIDAGCWVYGQANLLIAAGDTIAVYDVK